MWLLYECALVSFFVQVCRPEDAIVHIEQTLEYNVFVMFLFGWVSREGKPSAVFNKTISNQRGFDSLDLVIGGAAWPWEDCIAIEIKRDLRD